MSQATTHVTVLNSGGLRSLVATAMALGQAGTRVSLLHLRDGRPNAAARLSHTRVQAQRLGVKRVIEADHARLFGGGQGVTPEGVPIATLGRARLLLAALAEARVVEAARVVWPASVGGVARDLAGASEQVVLVEHLAELEGAPMPRIDTPLLELTDRQVIELGHQLEVPWELAWSCLQPGDHPCRACPGCRRRAEAFAEARLTDPLLRPVRRAG